MNATQTIRPAPIRKSFRVHAPREKAFGVFLRGMGRWWPLEHSVLSSPRTDVIVEPRPGGRWYETAADGSTSQWGRVIEWDEPERALLAWQLNAEFVYDPAFETEVEIRFLRDGDGTRIEFEHRGLEAFGEAAATVVPMMDAGWGQILELYEAEVVA
jgi:hypothetical protein